jgi:hypothetical protein
MAERAISPAMLENRTIYSEHQASEDVHASRAATTYSVVEHAAEEDWATSATQQESSQQQPRSGPKVALTNTLQPGSTLYPPDNIEGEFTINDADAWLTNMISNDTTDWPLEMLETEISTTTSLATDTRAAQGIIYKGCRCPQHQEIYNNWPTQDANLNIASCMKVCTYCGKDFPSTPNLRKHMTRTECKPRNLEIDIGRPGGKSSSTPSWTFKDPEPGTAQPTPEPESLSPNHRTTRSQALVNSTTTAPYP